MLTIHSVFASVKLEVFNNTHQQELIKMRSTSVFGFSCAVLLQLFAYSAFSAVPFRALTPIQETNATRGYSGSSCVFGTATCTACAAMCMKMTLTTSSQPACVNAGGMPGCMLSSNFVGACTPVLGGSGCTPVPACGGSAAVPANQCGPAVLFPDGTIDSCTNAACAAGGASVCRSCT